LHPERSVCSAMSDTKDYIIDQAVKLFLTKSYEAVSISDISKAIGLTKGALYHHFLNKEELFKAVIDKYLKIVGPGDFKEDITLAEYIEANIAYIQHIVQMISIDDQPFVPVHYLSLLIDALRHYPGYADDKEQLFNVELSKLKIILDKAVKNGEIRKDIDTSLVALNFLSITVGIAANLFRQNSTDDAMASYQSEIYEFYKILKI
jgi:TetR/AcrR family transcriptional regulator, transcriptional repressor for nem operon